MSKVLTFGSKPPHIAAIVGHPQLEYDQGDQVTIWYDDLYNLVTAARELLGFLEDTVTDPDAPEGIDLACSSTPLAQTLSDKLNALREALGGEHPAQLTLETPP